MDANHSLKQQFSRDGHQRGVQGRVLPVLLVQRRFFESLQGHNTNGGGHGGLFGSEHDPSD